MAKITEESVFTPSIYQLGVNDPVVGGVPTVDNIGNATSGYSNVPIKQLADRTKFLKSRVDTLNGIVDEEGLAERINNFLLSSGYTGTGPAGEYETYAAGITFTERNQVIYAAGEAWKPASATVLPYVTTGAGMPESGKFVGVGDAVLRQELASTDGVRLVAGAFRKGLIQGMPAPAYDVQAVLHDSEATDRRVIGIIGGLLYANSATALYSSADMGETWELVFNKTGRWWKMLQCSDGEILYTNGGSEVFKSSGWQLNPATATFASVVNLGPIAGVLRWSIDGDGDKFIVTHYSSSDRTASRYAFISTDAGDTWQQVWDSVDKFGQASADISHIHAVCYDPFNDRFWICEGHQDLGVWYSDNDGGSWSRLDTGDLYVGSTPTTLTATPYGIVAGTDEFPDGVHVIKGGSPETLKVEVLYVYRANTAGLVLQCDASVTDPDTGMVYISARGQAPASNSVILASNGESAGLVYESDSVQPIFNLAVKDGKFFAEQGGTPYRTLKGRVSVIGSREPLFDKGNYEPDEVAGNLSMALGKNARAPGLNAIAIGRGAHAGSVGGNDSMAVGINSLVETGQFNMAVGRSASITGSATYGTLVGSSSGIVNGAYVSAFGYDIQITSANVTAMGATASPAGSNSSVFGFAAATSGGNSASFGANASAAIESCAVGKSASANVSNSVAVGSSASSGSAGVSVGRSATSGTSSVAVGNSSSSTGNGVSVGANAVNAAPEGGTVVGRSASTTSVATNGVAIGNGASAAHFQAVALGAGSTTLRERSVFVGDRDIESGRSGSRLILRSPDGNRWAISVNNSGVITAGSIA